MAENPYQAPGAALDADPATGGALQEPDKVEAGRGTAWLGQAFDLFKERWLLWIGMTVVMGALLSALALVPLLNFFGTVLMPVFIGGLMVAASQADNGGELPFTTLFQGFRDHFIQLMGVGFLSLLGILAYMGFAFGLLYATGVFPAFQGDEVDPATAEQMGFTMPLAILGGMALTIPFFMATWFAPALITLHQADLLSALRMSFMGCLRNILPFLAYGGLLLALGFGLMILMLLLGLIHPALAMAGYVAVMLVLAPVMFLSQYTAHLDIYLARETA